MRFLVCVLLFDPLQQLTLLSVGLRATQLASLSMLDSTSIGSNTNCNGDGNCLFFGIFCARQQIGNGSQFGTTVWVGPQLLIAVRSLWALISIACWLAVPGWLASCIHTDWTAVDKQEMRHKVNPSSVQAQPVYVASTKTVYSVLLTRLYGFKLDGSC